MKAKKHYILLSFDVEEFDIPCEYGIDVPEEKKFSVSFNGLEKILSLLGKHNIKATFFTTASFALKYPDTIKKLAEKHEIASHGYCHTGFSDDDLRKSKETLEKICGSVVKGFRSPRLIKVDNEKLFECGYTYNSSENPTWIPGRYNNFNLPRTIYNTPEGILSVPASVSPLIRFPLFWIAFKNIPLPLYKFLSLWTLGNDGYLNIYFHPWEFSDLSGYALPGFIKKKHGEALLMRLDSLIQTLKKKAEFIPIAEFVQLRSQER